MKSFSTGDLSRRIGDVTHAASKAPVAITHHSKPRYVLLATEEFMKLRQAGKSRRAYLLEDTPDDLAEEMLSQMEAYLAKGDKSSAAA